jgi:hypothetical protein
MIMVLCFGKEMPKSSTNVTGATVLNVDLLPDIASVSVMVPYIIITMLGVG